MTLAQAIKDVRLGKAQRICKPAHWVVWREGERVLCEVMRSQSEQSANLFYP
jgi:hypothetical protein